MFCVHQQEADNCKAFLTCDSSTEDRRRIRHRQFLGQTDRIPRINGRVFSKHAIGTETLDLGPSSLAIQIVNLASLALNYGTQSRYL